MIRIHYCYMLQAGDYVKVGYSSDLRQRLEDIQTCCPYPVRYICLFQYATSKAAREMESFLHRKLKNFHSHGEWFHANKVINRMRREGKNIVRHIDLDEEQRSHMLSI